MSLKLHVLVCEQHLSYDLAGFPGHGRLEWGAIQYDQGRGQFMACFRAILVAFRERHLPVGLRAAFAAAGLAVLLCCAPAAPAQESHIGKWTGNARAGKDLFRRFCIGCHGKDGDGNGENAPYVDPKPRDFTLGIFKCRSTPTGSLPLDEDLFHTIGRGVDTTAMPSWQPLTDQQRADLVAYIKTFSPRFREEKPDPPVKMIPETPDTLESRQRGEVLYQTTLKCVQCHGETGKGNGPSAFSLHDDKEDPIKPYDFTTLRRFKCGDSNADLYRIFMTGLDGTPMPSFADYVTPDQAWDLVHYLRTLQVHRPGKAPAREAQTTANASLDK